jgi:Tfp pilus assembly protein PilX
MNSVLLRRRRGMVLVVVLVAIALLSLAGYTFAQLMFAEREAATAHSRAVQARASVDSGAVWIEHQLAQSGPGSQAGGAMQSATVGPVGGLYDNPALFRGMLVSDSDDDRDQIGRASCRERVSVPV